MQRVVDIALKYLGSRGDQSDLRDALKDAGVETGSLLRVADNPYPADLIKDGREGVTLMMQRLQPGDAPEADGTRDVWEVQSVHLEHDCWKPRWLDGHAASDLTAQQIIELMAQDRRRAMAMRNVASFTVPGERGRTWTVVALCEGSGKGLKSLTISMLKEIEMPEPDRR